MEDVLKALSLECLGPRTVLDTPHNSEIFSELEKLDGDYKGCSCKAERIPILARVYELCICMDVM